MRSEQLLRARDRVAYDRSASALGEQVREMLAKGLVGFYFCESASAKARCVRSQQPRASRNLPRSPN